MIAQPNACRPGIATFTTNIGRRTSPTPRHIAYYVRCVERRSAEWEYDVAFADSDRNTTGVLTINLPVETAITPRAVLRAYELGFYDNLHNAPLAAELLLAALAHVSPARLHL